MQGHYNVHDPGRVFITFSSRSEPSTRYGFPAISEADVHDPPLSPVSFSRPPCTADSPH